MAKKWLTLLLAMWMLLSCAALAEEPAVDFATLEGVIAYEEPVEISFARTVDATATIDESDPRMKSYSENIWTTTFKEALNIDVTYDWIATDADSNNAKWGAAIASGDLPDAASVSDQVYKQLLEAGLVADMTDIYEAEASSLYKSLNTQDILDNMTTGGRMYGLPLPGNKYIGNAVLFVRTDWMEQLGLELPETIDDVVNMARAFKEAKLGGEDTIGLMFADGSGVNDGHLQGFMNGYGAYRNIWVEVDGKLAWEQHAARNAGSVAGVAGAVCRRADQSGFCRDQWHRGAGICRQRQMRHLLQYRLCCDHVHAGCGRSGSEC